MKNLTDLYERNPEVYSKLMECKDIVVSVKLDGVEIQVLYDSDSDKIEYHKYSGSLTEIGPKISDYDMLFVKQYNDAIKTLESKENELKKYKFLNCERFDNKLYLINCISKDGELIKNRKKLKEIADSLSMHIKPIIFSGKLSKEQILLITDIIKGNDQKTIDEFKEDINEVFDCETVIDEIDKFKGLVFAFHLKDKSIEYKFLTIDYINKKFANKVKLGKINQANKDALEELAKTFVNLLKEKAEKLDNDYITSLEKNFKSLITDSKSFNKLLNISAKFINDDSDQVSLDVTKTSEEMQKLIKKYGDLFKLLYSKFIYIFYKPHKKYYIVNKSFQENEINSLINRMK